MLEAARHHLRETIACGDTVRTLDEEVTHAAPSVNDEERAALWLYAWHSAGDTDDPARRPARFGPGFPRGAR